MYRIKLRSNLLILFALIFIISCNKDDRDLSSNYALIKSKTQGTSVKTYTYDNKNRIVKIVSGSTLSTSNTFETFTYFQDTLYYFRNNFLPAYNIPQTLPNDIPVIRQYNGTYVLNSAGLFEGNYYNKLFSTVIIDGDDDYKYTYDNSGFIKYESYSVIDFRYDDTLKNDTKNYTKKTGITHSLMGSFNTSTTYEYFADKTNTIGNKNFGKLFLGRSSDNLLKSQTTTYKSADTTVHPDFTESIQYSFQYDAMGRVLSKTTETINSLSPTPVISTAFYSYY